MIELIILLMGSIWLFCVFLGLLKAILHGVKGIIKYVKNNIN